MRDSDLLSEINDRVFFESIFGPERDQFKSAVALYKALGGGLEE